MAHQDPVDPLSEFDTLLRQELSVEPTPNFLARVRAQIRSEPASARWMGLWRFVPVAVAATLVLVIGVLLLSEVSGPDPGPGPVASLPGPSHAPAPTTPPLLDVRLDPPSRDARRWTRGATVERQRPMASDQRGSKEPEVIVDAHQREALRTFVRMVNQGQLTGERFSQTTPPPLDIEEAVTSIGVVPVAVSPIVVGGVLQSERERK